jgi:hypothetical protein
MAPLNTSAFIVPNLPEADFWILPTGSINLRSNSESFAQGWRDLVGDILTRNNNLFRCYPRIATLFMMQRGYNQVAGGGPLDRNTEMLLDECAAFLGRHRATSRLLRPYLLSIAIKVLEEQAPDAPKAKHKSDRNRCKK